MFLHRSVERVRPSVTRNVIFLLERRWCLLGLGIKLQYLYVTDPTAYILLSVEKCQVLKFCVSPSSIAYHRVWLGLQAPVWDKHEGFWVVILQRFACLVLVSYKCPLNCLEVVEKTHVSLIITMFKVSFSIDCISADRRFNGNSVNRKWQNLLKPNTSFCRVTSMQTDVMWNKQLTHWLHLTSGKNL